MSSRAVPDSKPIRLLCVEDNPDDVELMGIALERADPVRRYELHRVDNAASFVAALEGEWDVILCDFNLPALLALCGAADPGHAPQQRAADRADARHRRGRPACTCCVAAPRTT
jgi:CheY-like chemotaxis protein